VTLLVVLAASLPTACGGASAGSGPAASATPTTTGAPPDFELEKLSGGTERLADHLGKDVVLVDFWATYCEPCLTSMPHLDALYRKYKDRGFVVLGVSIDGPDSVAQVRTEVQKLGVTFPILLDQETRVVSLYNPKTSAPYSVLIGRDGAVLVKREGYSTAGTNALDADVERALSAGEAATSP
jgi:peroxiredoxin